ncbi:hypothetical protein GCM10007973_21040 [Polymorphobacter multimanifer]|uniref:Uncharacterized protein n=1 Tax=Polymorphobacter multimanifer TaxID=1070431 RepID=A0A841LAF9_9SPHN|nr:hypothetical protein [Polymorphobacter multimanifer]MBB6226008.1 hypothetical protein [Polymorphobacter multimanifer]GGI84298.1 hypothetical protein GCM10007973_21040 [Polymorphobacter multimanifer]
MFNRALIAIAFAAAAVSAPAFAADANTCKNTPAALRSAAATAQPEQATMAMRLIVVGERLCDAGGRAEAGKKFASAAKALGTDLAALNTNVAAQ